jgi:hypothetical protein
MIGLPPSHLSATIPAMRTYVGLALLGLMIMSPGCMPTAGTADGGPTEEPALDAPPRIDAPGLDAPMLDDGGLDAPVLEDGGLDDAMADAGAPTTASFDFSSSVPAGIERTLCIVVDAGNDVARQVRSIRSTLSASAHHIFVSRTDAPLSGPTDCPDFGNAIDMRAIYASARPTGSVDIPTDAAVILAAHQHLQIEVHVVNFTAAALDATAMLTVDYHPLDGMVRLPAQLLLTGNFSFNVPSGVTTQTSFHAVPAGARIFGLSSHTHALGTDVSIHRGTSISAVTALMHQSTDWEATPLSLFDPVATFTAGEGLRLACTYNNTTGSPVTFGTSLTDEMCLLWAYHY